MRLRIPVGQVPHEPLAVGARPVGLGLVVDIGASKNRAPLAPRRKAVRVLEGVSALVAQELSAPLRGSTFDFHHLVKLELLQAAVREIERYGDRRNAARAEPLVAQITRRS